MPFGTSQVPIKSPSLNLQCCVVITPCLAVNEQRLFFCGVRSLLSCAQEKWLWASCACRLQLQGDMPRCYAHRRGCSRHCAGQHTPPPTLTHPANDCGYKLKIIITAWRPSWTTHLALSLSAGNLLDLRRQSEMKFRGVETWTSYAQTITPQNP